MEFSLTVILIIIAAILLLKVVKNIFSKLFGVLLIVGVVLGFMYYKGYGPFNHNVTDLSFLENKYCENDGDPDICECILKPARQDMANRFSKNELDSLAVQKIRAAYVLQKSLSATKEEALVCLASKGATDKYKVFLQDLVPIDNKYLDMIGDKARSLTDQLKGELNQLKEDKEGIDDKY